MFDGQPAVLDEEGQVLQGVLLQLERECLCVILSVCSRGVRKTVSLAGFHQDPLGMQVSLALALSPSSITHRGK